MLRLIVVLALCLPGVLLAQDKKKSAEQVWNDLYSKREGKEHKFNKFLAESVKGVTPGKALDIGMGQGRNSMFLAALGWDVTGFDISEVAVKQAKDMTRQVLMARVGIHHRLLFRVEDGILDALDLITREQLMTTLKRLRGQR